MARDALVVNINQYPFLKDTPTSKAKHLTTPASDAEAIALTAFPSELSYGLPIWITDWKA